MKNLNIKKRKIPDTRLPFVNTVVCEISFQGERYLVSSVWIGSAGASLYFWNPDTGKHDSRKLPRKIPGAYMLNEGSDGKLYIGCGNGDLIRYDPVEDNFEDLVTDQMHGISWGGCVTDRYAIWSVSPGETGVYDFKEKKLLKIFKPLDESSPPSLYGHSATEAPDGKIIIAMNSPVAKLMVLDIKTMAVATHIPAINPLGLFIKNLAFVSDNSFLFVHSNQLYLYSYPEMQPIKVVPGLVGSTGLGGSWCAKRKEFYGVATPIGTLVRFKTDQNEFEILEENWIVGDVGGYGSWKGKNISLVTVTGYAQTYNPETKESTCIDLEATGLLPAHALCVNPKSGKIVGAPFINQSFWTIDLATGEGKNQGRAGPGGGQINQIIWDPITSRFMLSSYTTTSVVAFDPMKKTNWPENPTVIASAKKYEQMRPMALDHDGSNIWMGTSPEYGLLGGALCRIDPKTGDIKVWHHIIKDQKINSLVVDPKNNAVYCGSDIYADCNSFPPTESTARIISFCTKTLTVIRSDILEKDSPNLKVLTVLKNDTVLVQQSKNLYSWNPKTGEKIILNTEQKNIRSAVICSTEEGVFISSGGTISRLRVENNKLKLDELIQDNASFLQIAENQLWYASGDNESICSVDLSELK